MRNLLSAFIILYSINISSAQITSTARIPQGKYGCDDQSHNCFYRSFLEAQDLIDKARKIMFPMGANNPKTERFISIEQHLINYWFADPALRVEFERNLELLDTKESHTTAIPYILINIAVYTVTEEGHRQIKGSIGSAPLSENPKERSLQYTFGLSGYQGHSFQVSAAISAQFQNNNLKEEISYELPIKNLDFFQKKERTPFYTFSPTGSIEKEFEGISVQGRPSVDIEREDLITLKNFRMTFGIKIRPEDAADSYRIKTIDTGDMDLTLLREQSLILFTSSLMQNSKVSGIGFTNSGGKRVSKNIRTMFIISARSVNVEEYFAQAEKNNPKNQHLFSKEEIELLPEKNIPLKTVLKSLKATSYFIPSSVTTPVIRFELDKSLASKKNYQKWVQLSVRSRRYSFKGSYKLENLMKGGVIIDPLPQSLMKKSRVKLRVRIKEIKKRMPWRAIHKEKFFYKPLTNEFIEL